MMADARDRSGGAHYLTLGWTRSIRLTRPLAKVWISTWLRKNLVTSGDGKSLGGEKPHSSPPFRVPELFSTAYVHEADRH